MTMVSDSSVQSSMFTFSSLHLDEIVSVQIFTVTTCSLLLISIKNPQYTVNLISVCNFFTPRIPGTSFDTGL